jgi:hypothetical protein
MKKIERIKLDYAEDINCFSLEDSFAALSSILLTNRSVGVCAVGTIILTIMGELGLDFFQKLGSKLSFISINVREK